MGFMEQQLERLHSDRNPEMFVLFYCVVILSWCEPFSCSWFSPDLPHIQNQWNNKEPRSYGSIASPPAPLLPTVLNPTFYMLLLF